MKDAVYLIFTSSKVDTMRKTKPDRLRRGEYAVKLNVRVPSEFFDTSIPEHTLEIARGQVIEPEVGVLVEGDEEGEGDRIVLDPAHHVEDLCDRVIGGETLQGIPDWAYHAVVAELKSLPFVKNGLKRVEHGLEPSDEDDRAVWTVRLADASN